MADITVSTNSIVQFVFAYEVDGQTNLNVTHYKALGEFPNWYTTVVGAAALEWINIVGQLYPPCWSNQVTKSSLTIQPVLPFRYRGRKRLIDTPGTVNSPPLPATTAAVIRRQSYLGGRRGMGRIFVGGLPTTFNDGSRLSPAGFAPLNALALALKESLEVGGNTLAPVVVNPATIEQFPYDVNLVYPDEILRVQRRREIGRGI